MSRRQRAEAEEYPRTIGPCPIGGRFLSGPLTDAGHWHEPPTEHTTWLEARVRVDRLRLHPEVTVAVVDHETRELLDGRTWTRVHRWEYRRGGGALWNLSGSRSILVRTSEDD